MRNEKIVVLCSLYLGSIKVVVPSHGDLELMPTQISEARAVDEAAIIAGEIRKQGFVCNRPLRAEPDRERSKPDVAVWVLKCQNVERVD